MKLCLKSWLFFEDDGRWKAAPQFLQQLAMLLLRHGANFYTFRIHMKSLKQIPNPTDPGPDPPEVLRTPSSQVQPSATNWDLFVETPFTALKSEPGDWPWPLVPDRTSSNTGLQICFLADLFNHYVPQMPSELRVKLEQDKAFILSVIENGGSKVHGLLKKWGDSEDCGCTLVPAGTVDASQIPLVLTQPDDESGYRRSCQCHHAHIGP